MIKLSCPFCNTVFDVVAPAPARIPCPRCDENVPATALAPEGTHATSVVEPRPREKPSRFWMIGVGIAVLAAAAFIADSLWETKLPPATVPDEASKPAATKPPLMLSSLRYLPANTQLVFALQPAALAEYVKRKDKSMGVWLAEAGLPRRLFDEFQKLDLTPEQIEQLAIALPDNGLTASVVLVLRKPLADDAEFKKKMNARPITDKPGHFNVELFSLPFEMKKEGETIYRFAASSESKRLDAPAAANTDHLPQGLRESLGRLSPASFAWFATDTARPDWSANDKVRFIALASERPEFAKQLEKAQAFALGLATEPELKLSLSVRSGEAKTLADRDRERLSKAKAEVTTDGEWAKATVPFDPPQDALATLRTAFAP